MVPVQTIKPAALPSLGFTLAATPSFPAGQRDQAEEEMGEHPAGPQEPRPGADQRVQEPCSPQPPECEQNQRPEPGGHWSLLCVRKHLGSFCRRPK